MTVIGKRFYVTVLMTLVFILTGGHWRQFSVMAGAEGGPAGWGPDVRLTAGPGESRLTYNFGRSLAADDAGGVHVVWYDTRDGFPQIYYKRSAGGGDVWEDDVRLSENPAPSEHPSIAVSGTSVYVVWHAARPKMGFFIYYKRSTDGGITWGPEIPLTASGASMHASVATSGANVHVVFGDARAGHAEVYTRRSTDGGDTWDPEVQLSEDPFESWVPTVAVSGEHVYVAWVDYQDANEEEYFRRSTDGGRTWGPVMRLTFDPADSWAPSLAVADETVHIVWFDRRDAGLTDADVEQPLDEAMRLVGLTPEPSPPRDPAVYYLPLFFRRVEEKIQQILTAGPAWVRAGGDLMQLESILQEFQRRMYAWSTGWEIYYKRSTDDGVTWGPDTRLTYAPQISARPSVVVSGTGVHVVWFDGRDKAGGAEIYYKQSADGGESWGSDTRLTFAWGDSSHPCIAVNDRGLHVVWHDEREGNPDIYYKRHPATGPTPLNR